MAAVRAPDHLQAQHAPSLAIGTIPIAGLWRLTRRVLGLDDDDDRHGFQEGIGIERDAVDLGRDQKLGECRIVAGRHAAVADLPTFCVAPIPARSCM